VRRSPQLARQWTLYDRDEHDRALQQARTLLPRLRGAERQEACRLIGLCYDRKKEHREALHWLQLACQGSEDSQVWLEVALAALRADERQLSQQALEQVRLCQQAARYAQPPGLYVQLFWYAGSLLDPAPRPTAPPEEMAPRPTAPPEEMAERSSAPAAQTVSSRRAGTRGPNGMQVPQPQSTAGQLEIVERRDQARQLLDELAAVYRRLYLTDTTFLYVRRMPFLSSFLTLAKRYFLLQGQLAEGVGWLQELAEGLDRAGQEQVELAIQALQLAGTERQREGGEPEPS